MVLPALANIDAENDSPTCDESVLNASNGTANLEINWEPNVIPLRWYSGNTLLEPENNDDTCTYDGVLNRPTNPTREGYNFAGWRVRPTYDFKTINTTASGYESWAIGVMETSDYCTYAIGTGSSTEVSCTAYPEFYKELQRYEWKVRLYGGDIYGSSYCSAKSGNANDSRWDNDSSNWMATYSELESAPGDKTYCWCQATGYKPDNSNTIHGPDSSTDWGFVAIYSSVDRCAKSCSGWCVFVITRSGNLRKGMFGITQ